MTDLDRRYDAACRIAREAGAVALDYFRRRDELAVEHKGVQDLVSNADREVEKLIRAELGRLFPDDAILGEEGGGDEAARLWVIDPIDGTANFLRGMPYWSMVLAYVVDDVTEIGITMDPLHDELFAARRGRGATRNGRTVRVSGRAGPAESCVGLSFNFKQDGQAYARMIGRLNAARFDHRRSGSTALALCHTADGRIDATLSLDCNSWDCLSGLILVEEAGGLATRYTDGHTLLDRRAIAACTPGIAGHIRDAADIGDIL
ncbi:MAG: inositol monophosphatase [Geminicoccaceae bacterium]|nr:inositol monophosphatase [Geminicoccaceae bacterium]